MGAYIGNCMEIIENDGASELMTQLEVCFPLRTSNCIGKFTLNI